MDYLISYEDETGLQHHGILGQKWGIRRYQNEDGTLTEAGRKRYSTSSDSYNYELIAKDKTKHARRSNMTEEAFKPGKDGKPSKAEKIARESANIVNTASAISNNRVNAKQNKQIRSEYETMTDAELRSRINRLQMEQQYTNLRSSDINRGKANVNDVLATAGTIVGIAGSAVGIATGLYQIKGAAKK